MFVMLMVTTPLFANDIYVTQSGASLTLDILQDGENNTIGNSTTASASTGATTSLNIDQVGNSNVIKYQINGATYTGVINLAGNSNDVDLNCDSGNSNSSCGSVNAVVNFTGNSNDIDLDIGQTSSATGADVDLVGYLLIWSFSRRLGSSRGVCQRRPAPKEPLLYSSWLIFRRSL